MGGKSIVGDYSLEAMLACHRWAYSCGFIDQTLCELRELLPDGLLPVRWRTRDYWDHLFESVGMKIRFSRAEEASIGIGMPWSFSTIQKYWRQYRNLLNAGDLRGLMRQYHERFCVQNRIQSTWHYYQIEASC